MTVSNWQQYQAQLIETSPKVIDVVKGRLPEYIKCLFVLSTSTHKLEDGTDYKLVLAGKTPNVSTCTEVSWLVLDKYQVYRGFASNETKADELAELVIRKPTPEYRIYR